jgi:hypothetical protein
MLFDNLDSIVIKQALMAKLQFSLGYRLIAAVLKANKPPVQNFETGLEDDSPKDALKHAKRAFITFNDYCMTHGYQVDTIEAVIESYVKGTGRQPSNIPPETIALRAKIAGMKEDKLKSSADKAREIAIGKQQEQLEKLKAEFMDLTIYANGYYHTDAALDNSGNNEHEDSYLDIDEIITDSWIVENYPKAVASQTKYWSRYNNWDDAEVLLISSDQETLTTSKA